MPRIEPFLRWAGGKTWIIPFLDSLINNLDYNDFYEPFVGGGAVFFSQQWKNRVYISDANQELIETYIAVRDYPNDVMGILTTYQNTKDMYYQIRATQPEDIQAKAARFIFLNQTSYNGLYRVNRAGQYNVPYGFRNVSFDVQRIETASQKLKNVTIRFGDFADCIDTIREKDLVFLDPPYTVSHNQNGFIKYNQKLFSIEDQYRLSKFIDSIKEKGAYYILTNAAHDTILDIFNKGDNVITLNRNSLIGGKKSKRGKIEEYVFTNIPIEVKSNEADKLG